MIRISKLTDYAMLVVCEMARFPERVLSANYLAEKLFLSAATVSKVLKILSEAKLLQSVRGAEGGYHLALEANKITVADVIMAMEGGLALTECCEQSELCGIDQHCGLKSNWLKINRLLQNVLKSYTVSDMLTPIDNKKALEELA